MNVFIDSFKVIIKKPILIFFLCIFVFVISTIEQYVLFPLLSGLNRLSMLEQFEIIFFFMQLIINSILSISLLSNETFLIIGGVLTSIVIFSFIFSGYFHVLNNAVIGKYINFNQFVIGVRSNFTKFLKITGILFLVIAAYTIFTIVILVPGIIVLKLAISGNYFALWLAIFVNLITAVVLFFNSMFFRNLFLYWYPAAVNHNKMFFKIGKYIANIAFWNNVKCLFLFDVMFIFIQLLLILLNISFGQNDIINLLLFMVNWIIKTVLFSWILSYIFTTFHYIKERIKEEVN